MMKQADPWLRASNLLAFLLMVGMNYLANALPLGGVTTGDVAFRYDNLILPAGYVFSIWGLIYGWMAVFIVWQLKRGDDREAVLSGISWFFVLSAFLNMMWLIAWHIAGPSVSLKVILLYFLAVLLLYLRLGRVLANHPRAWVVAGVPFSILLAWLSIALTANVSAFLVSLGWGGLGLSHQAWAIGIVLFTFLLALLFLWKRRDYVAASVFVWAWVGILQRRWEEAGLEGLRVVLIAVSVLTLLGIVWVLSRRRTGNGNA